MHAPLIFEALTLGFFAAFAVAAFFTRAPHGRRGRVALLSTACATGVAAAIMALPIDVRLWLGHAYLAAGYWIPALIAPAGPAKAGHDVRMGDVRRLPLQPEDAGRVPPQSEDVGRVLLDPAMGGFEAWLIRTEDCWRRIAIAPPVWFTPLLELSYLLCYVMLPVAFVFMWTNVALAAIDRFWTAVLLSSFACYGSLPWLISRPPRIVERTAPTGIGRLNVYVLGRVSHGLNTFPSGHVAVSTAAALEVMSVLPDTGGVLVAVAAGIAIGAVAGRYHYAVDVVLGLAIGAAASLLI